jgi:beta-phosphoglucomutase family hydrolase
MRENQGAARRGAVPTAGVIFDMDGVVIDSEGIHLRAFQEVLAPQGVMYTEEEDTRYLGMTDRNAYEAVKGERGLALSTEEFLEAKAKAFTRFLGKETKPLPGVLGLVFSLWIRRIPMALATSAGHPTAEVVLRGTGLDLFFDVVVTGDQVTRGKPAPDIFLEAARRLGVQPADCIVIEDSQHGVMAAKAAGMRCVAVHSPNRPQEYTGADMVMSSLTELDAHRLLALGKAVG